MLKRLMSLLDVCIEKNENNATVSDHLDKDEDTNETVQWRISPIETDTDNNQKNIRSKSKTHRVSKSVSEFNNQSNIKKRRRVPSSSKMQFNNKNKRNDRHNMESSPYSTVCSRKIMHSTFSIDFRKLIL